MQRVNLPIGTSDFERIRKSGCYYIDKTGLIGEILNTSGVQVMLITRPRRFGKTLGMNMLANFFDIRKNSKALFEGLEVSKDLALCEQWRNQYPTLFLSFKDVDGLCFENAFALLKSTFSQFCDAHPELENSERVTERQKEIFLRLR
ncbi:MAG: AAA family ATPase, partial [Firmicutes bacterium]|nr:AAA family ATPase [Bacillota bacterium]